MSTSESRMETPAANGEVSTPTANGSQKDGKDVEISTLSKRDSENGRGVLEGETRSIRDCTGKRFTIIDHNTPDLNHRRT